MEHYWFGWDFRVEDEFPEARAVREWVRETVYAAELDEKFYLIHDRSLLADFICPALPGPEESGWVEVIEFDDFEARDIYLEERWPHYPLSL